MTKNSQLLVFTIAAVAVILIGYLAWSRYFYPPTYQGSLIDPPIPAGDFTLLDQFGNPFTLSEQQDSIVLIFFGYTSCPDVCPTTLGDFKRIASLIGNDAENVRFLMITADPARDTPEQLGKYLNAFNPEFIGLTGTQEELDEVYQSFGVFVELEETDSNLNYLVSHTSRVYVINPDGDLQLTFPFGLEARAMADDIQLMLKESDLK